MKWLAGGVLVMVLFVAPMLGVFTQPWAGWYFPPPGTGVQPGVVPAPAMAQPLGPPRAAPTSLMAAVEPWMGVPYLFGGRSMRGVDCSAFIYFTGRDMGLNLQPPAENQFNVTRRVNDPQPGDLVFFKGTYCLPGNCPTITHVGWVIGDGWMISAAEPSVGRQSLSSPYWRSHLAGFGRLA